MDDKHVTLVADPYPPYQYEEGGAIKGIDADLIASAFQALGYAVHFNLLSWEECLRQLDGGQADGVFQITRTPGREERYVFSALLRTAETVLLTRSGRAIDLGETTDLREQLESLTLGVLSGYSYDPIIDSLDPAMKVQVERQEDLLVGLKEERFDLAIMDLGVAAFLMGKMGLAEIKRVEGFTVTRELHVAFRPKCRDLVRTFNAQLEKLKEQGTFERIMARYGLRSSI